MTNSAHYLSDLLAQLDASHSLEEVRTLCFTLAIDYDNLGGETKVGRLRELLLRLTRARRLPDLITALRRTLPELTWPDAPPDLELLGPDPFDPTPPPRLDYEPETAYVPPGPFVMGSDRDHHTEAPQHTIDLPGYRIGVTPITNEQYARFLWDTHGVAGPALLWDGNTPRDDMRDCPVLGVTWYEAVAYCRWLAGDTGRAYTLPSEAQWEKAARGPDGRLYPWGDEWDPGRCNAVAESVAPVRAFPAQSIYGGYDLVGNGREWTLSAWGLDPRVPNREYVYPWRDDGRNDPGLSPTIRRVWRGGRAGSPRGLRCSARGNAAPNDVGPRANRYGFRVALPAA